MSGDPTSDSGLAEFLRREPTPEAAAQFAEEYERLFAKLNNPTHKSIALSKLDGLSSAEIGAELGVSARTVDRKLQLIRAFWDEGKD